MDQLLLLAITIWKNLETDVSLNEAAIWARLFLDIEEEEITKELVPGWSGCGPGAEGSRAAVYL